MERKNYQTLNMVTIAIVTIALFIGFITGIVTSFIGVVILGAWDENIHGSRFDD
jgi:UPF0716 family protein affecting phage T7 exclusion